MSAKKSLDLSYKDAASEEWDNLIEEMEQHCSENDDLYKKTSTSAKASPTFSTKTINNNNEESHYTFERNSSSFRLLRRLTLKSSKSSSLEAKAKQRNQSSSCCSSDSLSASADNQVGA